MTGAGSSVVDHERGRYAVEVRSVNHRFLKVSVRAHGPGPSLDRVVEEAVRAGAQRGHVTVRVRFTPTGESVASSVNEAAFAEAAARLTALAREHDLEAVTVADVLRVPGIVGDTTREAAEELLAPAREAVASAVDDLVAARRKEGAMLAAEAERLLHAIAEGTAAVSLRAADVPEAYRDRVTKRLEELLAPTGVALDPAQVAREVAMLADRSDVREEIARLEAHLQHAREVLAAGGPIGRRLDFLVQEMHREVNTIGSKAADLELSRHGVDLKANVERLREQVQNIE